MANNPSSSSSPSASPEKKSSVWLVIIILVILVALLWPVLRRSRTGVTVIPNEESTTTSDKIPPAEDTSLVPSTPAASSPDEPSRAAVSSSAPVAVPASLSLQVFFGNQVRNPKTWQCSTVYPVVRTIANTSAVARAALTALLQGPSSADSKLGFFTSLNPGVMIKQLTINNGVARVDFDRSLMPSGGSACLKDGIRAQITTTLKQFSTVRSAIISINNVLF